MFKSRLEPHYGASVDACLHGRFGGNVSSAFSFGDKKFGWAGQDVLFLHRPFLPFCSLTPSLSASPLTVFVAVKGGTDTKSNEAISDDAMMRWVASHEQHLQNTFFLGELVYNERYRAGHPHAAPLAPFALLAHIFDA
eukprot:1156257-Pelagomonas_calceolata.AAC.4